MAKDGNVQFELAIPKPDSLIESLRSVGYSTATAVADIIDNSIAADARNVWVFFHWEGENSSVAILDDGVGMSPTTLFEAMRPGTQSPLAPRSPSDLGRFGLGLKTASFSQGRRLTVASKQHGRVPNAWRWDLDYVRRHEEWRLLKIAPTDSSLGQLSEVANGTLVLWEVLDRIVDDRPVTNRDAQEAFHGVIADVRQHLAMTFHRFLSGQASRARGKLSIFVNGVTAAHAIQAWDPFCTSHKATQRSPVEEIGQGLGVVRIQGYVLPHKDRLTDVEFELAAGPRGWAAQQGFYVYRNDRVLVPGDWLRLGAPRLMQKEEHYRLARLSIDISNSQDFEWSLDVKKSTARPPSQVRERLTDLAGAIRTRAREVFFHRGEIGARPANTLGLSSQRPWLSTIRQGRAVYKVNREHPTISGVLRRLGPLAEDVEAMIRLVEETVPVDRIWLDASEKPGGHSSPYEGLPDDVLWADMKKTFEILKSAGYSSETAAVYLENLEPFNRYQHLTAKLKEL